LCCALIACGGSNHHGPDAGDEPDAATPDAAPPVIPGADPTFGSGGMVTFGFPGDIAAIMRVARQSDGKIVGFGASQESLVIVRVNADGTFDSSFGGTGLVQLPWGVATNGVQPGYGLAIQGDGKIVVAARVLGSYNGLLPLEVVARLNSDGTLDGSFATGGIVLTRLAWATSLALQDDGKIVVGGSSRLERYNTDGTHDTAFGTMGVATSGMTAQDLALQSDGKIVVVGGTTIARFDTAGAVDMTFGTSGKVIVPSAQSYDQLYGIAIQSDGSILAAGGITPSGTTQTFWIGRYTSAGVLDTSFAGTGFVSGDTTVGGDATGVGIDPSGKIVGVGAASIAGSYANSARYTATGTLDVVGAYFQGQPIFSNVVFEGSGAYTAAGAGFDVSAFGYQIAIARSAATGAADQSFGSGGVAKRTVGGSFDRAQAVAFQPDGKLLVGGWAYTGGGAAMARLNHDGSIDTSFGKNGMVVNSTSLMYITSIAVQPTGNILVSGLSGYGSGASRQFVVERFDASGNLDMTFGSMGVAGGAVVAGKDAITLGMTIAPDGTIVLVGETATATSSTEYGVIELTADGAPVATFGTNGAAASAFNSTTYALTTATHALVQSDGSVVVLGAASGVPTLVRFTPAGTLDATFGAPALPGASNMLPMALASQPDGSIVAAADNINNGTLVVARFTAAGALDTTFASGGAVTKALLGNDYYGLYSFMGLVSLPNGQLELDFAAAVTADGLTENGLRLRLNGDGTTDETFGAGGLQTVAIGRGSTSLNAAAVDADGKLVVVGRTWTESGSSDMLALRLIP
jgi:uncharacterized delta-60 repeat protein